MTLHSGRSLNVAVRTDDSDSEDALGLITPSSDDDDEQVASGTPAPRVEVPVPLEAPHTLTRPSALAKESLTPVGYAVLRVKKSRFSLEKTKNIQNNRRTF